MTKFHDFKPMFHGIMRSICLKAKEVVENQLLNNLNNPKNGRFYSYSPKKRLR